MEKITFDKNHSLFDNILFVKEGAKKEFGIDSFELLLYSVSRIRLPKNSIFLNVCPVNGSIRINFLISNNKETEERNFFIIKPGDMIAIEDKTVELLSSIGNSNQGNIYIFESK